MKFYELSPPWGMTEQRAITAKQELSKRTTAKRCYCPMILKFAKSRKAANLSDCGKATAERQCGM